MTVSRRALLLGGGAALGGAAVGAVGGRLWPDGPDPAPAPAPAATAVGPDDATAVGSTVEPWSGPHQAGITTLPQAHAVWLALDLLPGVDRSALRRLMRVWTDDIARLSQGQPALADPDPELGTSPARLTVTVGFGRGVLAAADRLDVCPAWLAPLPPFAVDRLEERWSGGDLLLQVAADDATTVHHAVRVLTRGASTFASERWVQRGFRPAAGMAPPGTTMRNLMGQLDGTRNPDPSVEPELLWEADGPEWMVGGTSMVVRRIAMDLEAWDRVDRAGREHALGRRVGSGAPLTGTAEHDEPDLAATDALGLPVIDTAAHIRRARTQDPRERFLRRGYSFDDPSEPPATRAGLVFVAFQRDVLHQFVPVQERLAELDLMNVWTTPVGSAVFAVPGGVEPGGVLGGALLA